MKQDQSCDILRQLIPLIPALLLSLVIAAKAYGQDLVVRFDHQVHNEEYDISCEYCHYYAERSEQAGVPSLYDCLGCHQVVKGTTDERRFEIRKLEHHRLFKQNVIWTRVNDLPDFVYFSHQSHTLKEMECEECHGEVANIKAPNPAGKIKDLTMQWCMDCHVRGHEVKSQAEIIKGSTECHSCHK